MPSRSSQTLKSPAPETQPQQAPATRRPRRSTSAPANAQLAHQFAEVAVHPPAQGALALGAVTDLAHQAPALQRKKQDPTDKTGIKPPRDPFAGEKHAKATSFAALLKLVDIAEKRLNAAGHDTSSVIHILRGIFYGTTWSMDSDVEGSEMRNVAFQIYTASTTPDDPRPIIGKSLFAALKASAEVKDPKGRYVDFGHLIIGLDSRGFAARNLPIPSQGGSGQEINTWLGDLGGGAGMLAMKRGLQGQVKKRALSHFKGHDYGAVVNVEGDIAGVVGVEIQPDQTLAQALRAYLLPPKTDKDSRWNRRAQLMLESLGGEVEQGALANQSTLVTELAGKIESFGCWYAATRLKDKGRSLTPTMCRKVGRHIAGAAREVADIFVHTLVWAMADPKRNVDALKAGHDPEPSPEGDSVPYQLESLATSLELGKKLGF